MKSKTIIQNILLVTAWLLVGSGMVLLLAASNRKQKKQLCKQVVVNIKSVGDKSYIDKDDILQQLQDSKNILINKQVTEINLAQLERKLEKGSWIRDADLYFDSKNVLHIIVFEREPIARVFTTSGSSFYIDSAGKRMPLLDDSSLRLTVVTNFTKAKKLGRKDSLLLKELTAIIQYFSGHSFWRSQIAQVDITSTRKFELIPLVGNHVIRIGNGEQLEEKLAKLMIYYKQVAAKAGLDKYKVLDVQYKGQLLGIKKNNYSAIDSIQLQKNIKELMERTRLQTLQDSLITMEPHNFLVRNDTATQKYIPVKKQTPNPVRSGSNSLKAKSPSHEQITVKKKKEDPKPKAVMQRRDEEL
ncbi:MAG: hypothetical protein M3352_00910 [Bacteroidota bacterium]|nr:hypothetical protein [Bacteroidota bacterium]